MILAKFWDFVRNKIFTKIFEALFKQVGATVKKINFEQMLKKMVVLFIIIIIASNVYNGLSYDNYLLMLGKIIKPQESFAQSMIDKQDISENKTEQLAHAKDLKITTETNVEILKRIYLGATISLISLIICIILIILLILLKIEKRNRLQENLNNRRKIQKTDIKQPNALLRIIHNYERNELTPDGWNISQTSNKKQRLELFNNMMVQIWNAYKEICIFMIKQIYHHIHDINKNDTVHVSIKVLYDQDGKDDIDSLGFFPLGAADWAAGNDSYESKEFNVRKIPDMVTYSLPEDYALKKACENQLSVYRQADIKKFKEAQEIASEEHNMPFCKPKSIDREYNATMVCPIVILDEEQPQMVGVICVDTTSTYTDWEKPNSYEEELVTFVASLIGPMLKHNIQEIQKGNDLIGMMKNRRK